MKKRRFLKHLWKDEKGSELVEVVICLPVFMLTFCMFMSYAQVIFAAQATINAASSGARIAVTQETQVQAEEAAEKAIQEYMSKAGMGIQYTGDYELMVDNGWRREEICTCIVRCKVETLMALPTPSGMASLVEVSKAVPMMIEKGV